MKSAWIMAAIALALPACAQQSSPTQTFSVAVTDARDGRFTPAQYASGHGCTGENISPAIAWQGAPADAKSFAVTIFDPDAPGNGFWHWLASGIPATTKGLEAGVSHSPALTALGVTEGTNGFGASGYGGPCPPQGQDHRYVVTVYAMGVETLNLPAAATPQELDAAIKAVTIARAETTIRAAR
jgi:Raf kinase inhibitor-like YbhB/YbcL family protein